MTISDHIEVFAGLPVMEFNPDDGLEDASSHAWRIAVDYEEEDEMLEKLQALIDDPEAGNVRALVIGAWGNPAEGGPWQIIDMIAEGADRLTGLKAIFIGEITFEECEASWIIQNDPAPILKAYPGLEELRIRGANELRLSNLDHRSLRSLAIESGGLPSDVIESVMKAKIPNLEHLELWLGDDNYGWDGDTETLAPILQNNPFPKLKYLGIRNSIIADDIAKALMNAPVLERIEVLDLSLGTLSDDGGEALLANPSLKRLKNCILNHHFMSEDMVNRLKATGAAIEIDEGLQSDDDYRYISVSE